MGRRTARTAAQKFAADIIDSEDYRRSILRRLNADELPPQVETTLLHYRYGKPPDEIIMSQGEDLSDKSPEELLEELRRLEDYLQIHNVRKAVDQLT